MAEKIFSEVFTQTKVPAGRDTTIIKSLKVNKSESRIDLECFDPTGRLPSQWETFVRNELSAEYDVRAVNIVLKRAEIAKQSSENPVLFGKPITKKPISLTDILFEEGTVCCQGEIIEVTYKEFKPRGNYGEQAKAKARLTCDITDHTGAIRISLTGEVKTLNDLQIALTKTKNASQWLLVSGKIYLNTYNEISEWLLSPTSISVIPHETNRTDTSEHKRVELHLHTQMSNNDATTDVQEVIKRAAKWGHKAIAITDHGVCHSFPEAMKAASKTGVKVIYGVEGYTPPSVDSRNNHIIILATNLVGLKNLYQLVSLSHLDHWKRRPRIPIDLLTKHREGLIIGSACEAGDLFKAVIANKPREQLLELARFYDYLEIQPICNNAFLVRNQVAANEDTLRDYNKTIVSLADELDLPVCATCDVHFLDPEDEIYRKVLQSKLGYADFDKPLPLFFRTTDEMLDEFSYLGSEKAFEVVVTNPNAIAERCEAISPIKPGEFSPKIEGSAEELRRLSMERAYEIYGNPLPEILSERLETELNSIINKGYDVIYIIAQKIVQRSLECGYYVGSRGSVGSSIVAFLSGITEVNALPPHYYCKNSKCKYWEFPDKESVGGSQSGVDMPDKACPKCGENLAKDGFDISFATFLGFYADKKPDIDLNFSDEYQPLAHQHTVEIFGKSHVFRAGTILTIQGNNAKVLAKKFLEKQNEATDNPAMINYLAQGCVGVRDSTGQHPGGLIVVPEDCEINDFCPVHYPANDTSAMITTHFDYHSIEENLLKLDLLGHRDPTMIRMLEALTGIKSMTIPLDDPDTMSIFQSSEVLGFVGDSKLGETGVVAVPEFGTKFVRQMLLTTKPSSFDDLLRISGLSHGTNVWKGNQEDLILNKTATFRQIVCSRDDIMNYLINKGMDKKTSFTIMESVRKGKGLRPEWEADMRAAKVPEWYITACKKIEYMFPRAHAVAYVMMAYRIAWYKVHKPLQFYCAYFSKRAKQFDYNDMTQGLAAVKKKVKSIESKNDATDAELNQLITLEVCYEFYLRGFSFAALDLYKSDVSEFKILNENTLLPPFTAIANLGEKAAANIAAARGNTQFISIEEVQLLCKISQSNIDAIKATGALAGLPDSTQITLF